MDKYQLNTEVTKFLDEMNHPLRTLIELMRRVIMSTGVGLSEGIKWNGPNYSLNGEDRITLKLYPPKQIQMIFHRGAKVKEQPKERLIKDEYSILTWKENDRAIAAFKSIEEFEQNRWQVKEVVTKWIDALR